MLVGMRLTQASRRTALTESVAGEIRAEMARQRITQRDVARRLEVIEAWLSRRLNGHVSLNLDELEQISKALQIPMVELIRRAEERVTHKQPSRHPVQLPPARPARGGPRRPVRLCPAPPLAA